MPRYRGPRWERASVEERLLLLEGVPSKYWHPLPDAPTFIGMKVTPAKGSPVRIPAERQREVFKHLIEAPDIVLESGIIAIGAQSSDEHALHCAIDIARPYLAQAEEHLHAKVVDLGDVPALDETDHEGKNIGRPWWRALESAAVIIFHNVTVDSDDDRTALLRDLMVQHPEAAQIIVIAGSAPIDFMLDRVYCRPDVVFYAASEGIRRRRSR